MKIEISHGAGGALMQELIEKTIVPKFGNTVGLDDSAIVLLGGSEILFTTDSHTIKPIFFPDRDIGYLSVAGTVNDILAMGGELIALSSALVIEEGLEIADLEKILDSMRECADLAGVNIVTGDTKVMERGGIDRIVINTSAIGKEHRFLHGNFEAIGDRKRERWTSDSNLRAGDKIIISGNIGEHGAVVLGSRYGVELDLVSDVNPLNEPVEFALKEGGVTAMKDPTRGGVANALNEWSSKSSVSIGIDEDRLPIPQEVISIMEMLGIDPLNVGNEGKMLFGVIPEKAEDVLRSLKRSELGRDAEIIGEVFEGSGVFLKTDVGGKRILPQPIGDPVPRIC